jgi:HPt (histidine-containing phosphotransfer) domain-containing protein
MSEADRKDFETADEVAPFDLDGLQKRLGDDKEAASAVLRAFVRNAPGQLARLHDAVEKNDAAQVRFLAHTLKGSLLWIGAADAAAAASTLEQSASLEPGPTLGQGLATLSEQVDRLLAAIAL